MTLIEVVMDVTYDDNKECRCYKNFVENSTERAAIKEFNKRFNGSLRGAAVKTHSRLCLAKNASEYNLIHAGGADNTIQKKSGEKDNEPLTLKVRIDRGYRKFFHFYQTSTGLENECFCLNKEWRGQFSEVEKLYIYQINKHEY